MQNRPLMAAILGALLILIGIGFPIFTGRLYVETDLGNFHVPIRQFYASQIAAGESFLWFPYTFNGFHLHGEGQASLFHPLQWLLYRFVPVSPAIMLEVVRNYLLLAVGAYLLLRRYRLPREACAFGALAAAFSSFQMLHFMHLNVVAITAHLPWMLLFIDIALRAERPRDRGLACVGLAVGTASQLLHGHPQFAWLVAVGEGVFALGVVALRGGALRLPWLVVAQGLGCVMAAAQLLPQWESLAASWRADPGLGFASTMALDPRELSQLVAPYLYRDRVFGDSQPIEYSLYAGAAFPVLVAWLVVRRSALGALRAPALWLAVACVGFLWMGLGESGQLFRLQAMLPGLDRFRAPARYILLFQAASAGLAAIAFTDLVRFLAAGVALPWRRIAALAVPLAVALVVVLLAPLFEGDGSRGTSGGVAGQLASLTQRAAGPLLIALATALVVATARLWRGAVVVLVLFVAADLGVYGLTFMRRMPPMTMQAFVDRSPVPPWADHLRVHFGPAGWTVKGVRLSSGYVAMIPDRQLPTDVYEAGAVPAAQLIPALRVSGIGAAFGRRVPDPLPRVRLVAGTRAREADVAAQLASTDVDHVVILPEAIDLPPGPAGDARLRVDRPGHIEVETESTAPRVLVLAESHHPGWRVRIDGEPGRVLPAYGDFMACVVPAGRHRVAFRFEPESVANGLRISAVGVALLPLLYLGVAGGAAGWARRKTV